MIFLIIQQNVSTTEIPLLKYWYIVVNLGFIPLCNTFSNPHDVTTLLLLQLNKCVEDAEVKLSLERERIQFHFVFEESIFQGLFSGIISSTLEQLPVVLSKVKGLLQSGAVLLQGWARQLVLSSTPQLGYLGNNRELKHVGRQHDDDGQNKFLQINDSEENLSYIIIRMNLLH